MKPPLLSIVIPVYFEEDVLEDSYRALKEVCEDLEGYEYELIFVDDGSRDRSLEILQGFAQQDVKVKVLSFSCNFGHQIAITAGIERSQGDAVVVIDGDLQDPPQLIPKMLERWQEGYHVVYAKRTHRQGESWFKKATASWYYRFLNQLSDTVIPQDTGDFRLMDRKAVDALCQLPERHRFVRGLVSWVGFEQTALEYVREPRLKGETKYPLKKMIKLALDGILSFSNKPLKLALRLGFLSIILAFLVLVYGLIVHAAGSTVRGWTSTMVTILFLGGTQLFTIGIIGEYLSRIYDEIKQRPLYLIKDEWNFNP